MNAESDEFANRADYTDYVPGLDYSALVMSSTGNFDTDKSALYSSGERINSFFPYTVNKGTTPTYGTKVITDFKTDAGNTYWTIDNVDYLVRPTEKVIKLVAGVNTGKITDEALKTRFSTLAETTVDVKDGYVDVVNDKILPNDKIDFIIPAGTAVQNAREELGDIFNSSDGQHLKSMGYYLAGLAWLEKITGVSTENLSTHQTQKQQMYLTYLKSVHQMLFQIHTL